MEPQAGATRYNTAVDSAGTAAGDALKPQHYRHFAQTFKAEGAALPRAAGKYPDAKGTRFA